MFSLSISSPTGGACTLDFSPSQAITHVFLFYFTADKTLTEQGRAVRLHW